MKKIGEIMREIKQTPKMKLTAAYREWHLAQEDCPHWDYEGNQYCGLPCCVRLSDAEYTLGLAKNKYKKSLTGSA